MRRRLLAPLAIVMLAGCQPTATAELAVQDAWVRLAAVPGRPGAAYFTLRGGDTADRLIAVESPKVATIELHQGGMEAGMMTMKPLSGADVPAGAETAFAPGGNHAMLFGVDPSIRPGSALPLAFRFRSGKTLAAEAKVLAAGDAAPEHEGH
jgi:copper(I)-binding protein